MKEISPQEAKEWLDSGQGYVYLDVRSKEEFAQGRPAGAVNVPLMNRDGSTGKFVANPLFMDQVREILEEDSKIICGCKSGGRSARAADMMAADGFEEVANMRGGFSGARDPQTGTVLEPGWMDLGLPTEQG